MDGTLSLADVQLMNNALNVSDENERRLLEKAKADNK